MQQDIVRKVSKYAVLIYDHDSTYNIILPSYTSHNPESGRIMNMEKNDIDAMTRAIQE